MITRYNNVEESVQLAQKAIDSLKSEDVEENKKTIWFQKILNLLKDKKYVTIQDKNGNMRDVHAITNTHSFLSFFDVWHEVARFDLDIEPIETVKLEEIHISYGFDSCLFK